MKRFLFYMGHPAHYHNFKHSINGLVSEGHTVKVVARGKDVLFDLLGDENWDIVKLNERKPSGKWGMVKSIAGREMTMFNLARKFKPHVMIGTDLVITHVGKILKIPSVVVNEDDSAAIPLMAKYAFPYATAILAPHCCDQSPFNHKKIAYRGYHELAYLHPDFFSPNPALLPDICRSEKYFLLRFASLHAHHDQGRSGISDEIAMEIISLLMPYGKVFINSERAFSKKLAPYRLQVPPAQIHQVMAHAAIYIGDSQTMAAEAAVLGVPSIRFNDFVGELSYLEELEHIYGLTLGIRTHAPDLLLRTVQAWAATPHLKEQWQHKRAKMLEETINVTPFWMEEFLRIAHYAR